MFNRIKNILFIICIVMVFTAQTKRPDDKGQQHASAPRPAPANHSNQTRPQAQSRPQVQARTTSPQAVHRSLPRVNMNIPQPLDERRGVSRQQDEGPRVYAVPTPAPVANNRFLNRQHSNHWQPRYNFYDNGYHFYPYVNITSLVELSGGYLVVGPDGQNYYYDQGTFYLQDQTGQYVAVPPPVGIIVNPIVPQARQIDVNGQIYYRYKGVFYVQVAQGYQVVAPVQPVPADS